MKTAISLPDDVYRQAEIVSRRRRMTRSELYVTALRWYLAHEGGKGITAQLDAVHGKDTADPVVELAGVSDLPREDW